MGSTEHSGRHARRSRGISIHRFWVLDGRALSQNPEFRRVFDAVRAAQGRGDATLIGASRATGIEAVTFEKRLTNFITYTLRDPTSPVPRRMFGESLHGGLRTAGYEGTIVHVQGSAVTGRSFRTGRPFDVGRRSDFDIALSGEKIISAARRAGIPIKTGGHTRPLSTDQVRALGLEEVVARQSRLAGGRTVNFMLFESTDVAVRKAPSFVVPGG